MNFQQFLLVLQARWLVVAITLLVAVASTLVISSLLAKNYTATASLGLGSVDAEGCFEVGCFFPQFCGDVREEGIV